MAKPFLHLVDKSTTETHQQSAFMIVVTVWNAVVFDIVLNTTNYTEMLRRHVRGTDSAFLLEALICRKRELFGEDLRAIGDYRVTYKDGNLNVWAEACRPTTESG
ncbi:MAG TPA: hypothetical protein DCP92_12550 [Nitrospiraceae bacterium]|jgi:hypothetical protein|nr:hypothetical protein [Nitrospiraceae bacterium]